MKGAPIATGEELVLVHLLDSPRGRDAEKDPSATQSGIAEGTGLDRSYVSVVLKKAEAGGFLRRSLERVAGSPRKVSVFALTPPGFERALSIKQRLLGSCVRLRRDGKFQDVELREALSLFEGESAASIIAKASAGALDADSLEPISSEVERARALVEKRRFAECAALLRRSAERWTRCGCHDDFLDILELLRREGIGGDLADSLLLAEADIRETRGELSEAVRALDRISGDGAQAGAEASFRRGVISFRQGDAAAAEGHYKDALELIGKPSEGSERLRGRTLNAIGVLRWASKRASEAEKLYREAEGLALESADAEGLMRVRANMGILAEDAGDHASAIDNYAKAITVAEAISDLKAVCSLYSNVADVYAAKGQRSEAERFYGRSMALAEKLKFTWQIAEVHRSLAKISEGKERAAHLKNALMLFEKVGAKEDAKGVRAMIGE